MQVIDSDGYRANVGIVIFNEDGKLFWARRIGQDAWQFPQGGISFAESPEQAVFRELKEETGLTAKDVEIVSCTEGWLRYDLPDHMVRRYKRPVCIGQKQKWFMLRLLASESSILLNKSQRPEFDCWKWVDYWQPVNDVIEFKHDVYQAALKFFAPQLEIELKQRNK
ncbi:MAG: RNA pyrophosphohydrolase [gamma proteobacterium symbiont of Taylorina sp.]|nr:RNA pyrophosphohydrolase [gamma proteobacterium symbiont of Taylorina sp.]